MTAQPTIGSANAWLHVRVHPDGASVSVDGLRSGTTPVSLEFPPGQHTVRVEQDGHEPLVQAVDLMANGQTIVTGGLVQIVVPKAPAGVPPTTPTSVPRGIADEPLPDLVVKSIKIELETGGACDYASTQLGVAVVVENSGDAEAGRFVVDVNGAQEPVDTGLAPGETTTLWFKGYGQDGANRVIIDAAFEVDEITKDNNMVFQRLPIPTLPPTCTPLPTPSAYHGGRVHPRLGSG